jgi:putative phosphoribosyl transferase
MERIRFADRTDAGRLLAEALSEWRGRRHDTTVIGLPRGGVAVAAEVAAGLGLPLATWAVRKLAHPSAPECAIGAIAPGVLLWDEPYLEQLGVTEITRRRLVAEQEEELLRRRRLYGDPPASALAGRHLIVVDDGVATGLTVRAALQSLRQVEPASLILAVPVADVRLVPVLERLTDQLVVLRSVRGLEAVGSWYERFDQVHDAEVLALLEHAR